jgi:hypothetical protein
MDIKEILINTQELEDIDEKDENDENNEEINIDDYTLAPEENEYGNFVNLLNIFTCYYKKLFNKKETASIFDGIDYDKKDSTNRYLEFLYEEIFKFKKSTLEDKEILYGPEVDDIDINKCNELYALYIDNELVYMCKFLLPLLQDLSEKDWLEMNWSIMPLKN